MTEKRVAAGRGTGLGGDDRAEQNREFGHADQQFGGGANDEEYGEPSARDEAGLGARPMDRAAERTEETPEERLRARAVLEEEE